MSKGQSLQDPFLNALRRERVPVSIYLVNGIKLQGTVESFDQFVVLLRNTVSQMVYKHAISTIVPGRNVRIGDPGAHEDPPLVISIDASGNLRFGTEMTPVTLEGLTEKLVAAVTNPWHHLLYTAVSSSSARRGSAPRRTAGPRS